VNGVGRNGESECKYAKKSGGRGGACEKHRVREAALVNWKCRRSQRNE